VPAHFGRLLPFDPRSAAERFDSVPGKRRHPSGPRPKTPCPLDLVSETAAETRSQKSSEFSRFAVYAQPRRNTRGMELRARKRGHP
jgi:hypothetical protein